MRIQGNGAARRRGTAARRAIVALVAAATVLASSVGIAPAAYAATTGITAGVTLNGETYQGTPVVTEGDVISLNVQYTSAVGAGTVVEFDLGTNVTLTGVPAGNQAVKSFVQQGNKVIVTFESPWPDDVEQGIFKLDFTINQVQKSENQAISWKVDGEEDSIDVIVKNVGDTFADVKNGSSKSVTPGNLDSLVEVDAQGKVHLKPAFATTDLSYTLRLDSEAARSGFPITDQLPAGLSYVSDSFAGSLTTWDADGLNKSTAAFPFAPTVTGSSFTSAVDVPGPSQLALTYKVRITDPAPIEALLQAKYDALGGKPGNFETSLTNTASFDGVDKTASVRLRGTVAGVNVGSAFGKTGSWTHQNVDADEDGTVNPAADIDYTLKADLRQWDDRNANFTLKRNVVISDTLPTQASWNTSATGFLTANGITLAPAADCPSAQAFAGDAYVGTYCVNGQTLLINVGKDKTTNATIIAKAQLNSVKGLTAADKETTVVGAKAYQLRNVAGFTYENGKTHSPGFNSFPVVLPETDEGLNDPRAFSKRGTARDASIQPGESAVIDYAFALGAGKGVDMRNSYVVDYIDSSVYDITDATALPIVGNYSGQALDASHFALSLNSDGDLVIALSDAGKAVVTARGADKAFTFTLTLTTMPFEGKVTKTIKNKATLFGENDEPLYWFETSSEATSFGDEAEVRKRLLDPSDGEWVETLDAQIGVDGELVRDVYTYRVEFLPHGSYDNVTVADVSDLLPSTVEFLGFVTEQDAADATNPTPGPVDIGGNLEATYDQGVVKLKQKDGTRLQAGDPIAAYFAVKINDHTAPIVNRIGSTQAVINPVPAPSIDIEKWTGASGPEYAADGALTNDGYEGDFDAAPGMSLTAGKSQVINFTVSNDGGEALQDVAVADTLTSGEGEITDLVCTFPDSSEGTIWAGPFQPGTQFGCTGTVPALKAGQAHADLVTVTGTGIVSGDTVGDDDEWYGTVPNAETPVDPDGDLATTGSTLPVLAITFGAALALALGAMLLLLRRRRMS